MSKKQSKNKYERAFNIVVKYEFNEQLQKQLRGDCT